MLTTIWRHVNRSVGVKKLKLPRWPFTLLHWRHWSHHKLVFIRQLTITVMLQSHCLDFAHHSVFNIWRYAVYDIPHIDYNCLFSTIYGCVWGWKDTLLIKSDLMVHKNFTFPAQCCRGTTSSRNTTYICIFGVGILWEILILVNEVCVCVSNVFFMV